MGTVTGRWPTGRGALAPSCYLHANASRRILTLASGGAVQGPGQGAEDAQRQQPPGVNPGHVDHERGDRQARGHQCGDVPVVADDEVAPERAERLELAHELITSEAGESATEVSASLPQRGP